MQLSLKTYKWRLSLEDHFHLALATTHILQLTPGHYPSEMKPFVPEGVWKATIAFVEESYGIQRQPMPITTITTMLSIIDQLQSETITRKQAVSKLASLELTKYETKFADALAALVIRLPRISIEEDANESELCARFADPFLAGLFDDPDNGVYLRWTNETTLEAKTVADASTYRPDLTITKSCGVKWESTHGYGEAKSAIQGGDNYLLTKDLFRVAVLCKDALDEYNSDGVLGIQIVGRTVKFYVVLLPTDCLYTLLKLAEVKIPDSLALLNNLVSDMACILKVLYVFDQVCCTPTNGANTTAQRRPTIQKKHFDQLFSKSKNRKRACHQQLRHN
ncbi:hypothetical protein DM01DRAFT_1361059 [Hesseltinella vesiculosa]|uniref:Uncharacterized protein n=1 Tax=Hesseltinella vesiculosa TaxID=101127 RepID=A0A1X2GVE5_9FUNG|nr:hypothetical protein DM01DRAFT_1361059 [Hesseltinella vesiculosa]